MPALMTDDYRFESGLGYCVMQANSDFMKVVPDKMGGLNFLRTYAPRFYPVLLASKTEEVCVYYAIGEYGHLVAWNATMKAGSRFFRLTVDVKAVGGIASALRLLFACTEAILRTSAASNVTR